MLIRTGMLSERYTFRVEAENQAVSSRGAGALADRLREADGVVEAERGGADVETMDLGTVVTVIASSGATLALAEGLAAWLRARRGTKISIERDGASGSIKAAIEGIDPAVALRVVELIRG